MRKLDGAPRAMLTLVRKGGKQIIRDLDPRWADTSARVARESGQYESATVTRYRPGAT